MDLEEDLFFKFRKPIRRLKKFASNSDFINLKDRIPSKKIHLPFDEENFL